MSPSPYTPWPCFLPHGHICPVVVCIQWGMGAALQKSYTSRALPRTSAACICLWLQKPCHTPCMYSVAYKLKLICSQAAEPDHLPHFHVLILLTGIPSLPLVKSLPVREEENPHLPIWVITKKIPFRNGFLQTKNLCAFQLINHIRKQHAVSPRV